MGARIMVRFTPVVVPFCSVADFSSFSRNTPFWVSLLVLMIFCRQSPESAIRRIEVAEA